MLPTAAVPNNNANATLQMTNAGNLLTQLLQASATNDYVEDQRRLFTVHSCVIHSNEGVPKSITRNPDIPGRQVPSLNYFLDMSEMEPSNKGLTNFNFLNDDTSTPSLTVSHCSEDFQVLSHIQDNANEDVLSSSNEDKWEELHAPQLLWIMLRPLILVTNQLTHKK